MWGHYTAITFFDGCPNEYLPLNLSNFSKKEYISLYNSIRQGYKKGCIYLDKQADKWCYGILKEHTSVKKDTKLSPLRASQMKEKLISMTGKGKLKMTSFINMRLAAKIMGVHPSTLAVNIENFQLLGETPTDEDRIKLKLHWNTKYIIQIQELLHWLDKLISQKIKSSVFGRKTSRKTQQRRRQDDKLRLARRKGKPMRQLMQARVRQKYKRKINKEKRKEQTS